MEEDLFPHPILRAAEAKLKRAAENLQTLGAQQLAAENASESAFSVDFEPNSGWWVAKIGVPEEPPPDLGVLVGDIGYQCLSALNLVIWELAARKIGRRKVFDPDYIQHVQLPIAETSHKFRSNPLVGRALVSKPALAIIEGLQPHAEGHGALGPREHPLFVIKEIADSDKHRVLARRLIAADLARARLQWDGNTARDPCVERLIEAGSELGPDDPILRLRFAVGNEKANVQVKTPPKFTIRYGTDNWTVPYESVAKLLGWTHVALQGFKPVFPVR